MYWITSTNDYKYPLVMTNSSLMFQWLIAWWIAPQTAHRDQEARASAHACGDTLLTENPTGRTFGASQKPTDCYGDHHFLIGKLSISMTTFNSYVELLEGIQSDGKSGSLFWNKYQVEILVVYLDTKYWIIDPNNSGILVESVLWFY